MAVWPHGWKVISHGPSQRKQPGPVSEPSSGCVASLLRGVSSPLEGVALSATSLGPDLAVLVLFNYSGLHLKENFNLHMYQPQLSCVWGQEGDVWVDSLYNDLSCKVLTIQSVFKITLLYMHLSGLAKSCSREQYSAGQRSRAVALYVVLASRLAPSLTRKQATVMKTGTF